MKVYDFIAVMCAVIFIVSAVTMLALTINYSEILTLGQSVAVLGAWTIEGFVLMLAMFICTNEEVLDILQEEES